MKSRGHCLFSFPILPTPQSCPRSSGSGKCYHEQKVTMSKKLGRKWYLGLVPRPPVNWNLANSSYLKSSTYLKSESDEFHHKSFLQNFEMFTVEYLLTVARGSYQRSFVMNKTPKRSSIKSKFNIDNSKFTKAQLTILYSFFMVLRSQ